MTDASAPIPGHAGRLERLIVTRPAPEAAAWVDVLRGHGWPAQALPLIYIAPPEDEHDLATLEHWRRHWMQADAILFVSGAAVTHFFAHAEAPVGAPLRTRFWAPGPGTARLLEKAIAPWGLGAERIDSPPLDAAQFDSEHLWPVVAPQVDQGRLVLIVRGSSGHGPRAQDATGVAGAGRDWLIQQCLAAGAQVQGCVAYARRSPPLSTLDHDLLAAACGPHSAWLFSSSEALIPLQAQRPAAGWAQATAIVTHPRIAAAARLAGFDRIVPTRPALDDVMRTLESGWPRP
ncbi:uroporphyrinogen-III synthase [Hydrogenophaga sp.]|uniref:uroporphyrinogen-III synthase n=1 Tax=Hydrogenophaga sp. TaxID=1904254 RepID=UPI0025BB6DD5|nr:uroporphyrinogen-III synthase [Hydrogenophaga sp.]